MKILSTLVLFLTANICFGQIQIVEKNVDVNGTEMDFILPFPMVIKKQFLKNLKMN